jgi:hypothetical protein
VAVVALGFASSCATNKGMRRGTPSAPVDLEKEIPSEIGKSYEVSEAPRSKPSTLAPTIVSEPSPENITEEHLVSVEAGKKKKDTPKKAAAQKSKAKLEPTFQMPNRRPSVDPFFLGERVTYEVTWLKTTAGEMTIETLPMKYMEGRKVYHFRGTAKTTSLISHIYKAEEIVESFVDFFGLVPYKFTLRGDETKYVRQSLELFDHGKGKQFVYVKDDRFNGDTKEEKGIKDLTPMSQDALSVLFYLRLLDLKKDQSVNVPVAVFGKMSDLQITWVGDESVKTKAGRFDTKKLRVQVHYKREKRYDDNYFWVTSDDRRHIVKFEMKVRIGWMGGVAKDVVAGTPFPGESE